MARTIGMFLAALVLGSVAHASVWTATSNWSEPAEREFATFINELPLDYFSNPSSPYYGIETDCADAAYTLRTIFAYEHRLPVDFYNHDGRDLSNRTTAFDGIPAGAARLRRFITEIRLHTDTGTIIRETYPIAINRKSIRPGTMFLHSPKGAQVPAVYHSAHVFYVQGISNTGLVTYISSTVPIAVRNLNARFGYTFIPFNENSGYRAWKWPGTQGQDLRDRAFGSTEQFEIGEWQPDAYLPREKFQKRMEVWTKAVRDRIKGAGFGRQIDTEEEMKAVTGNIISGVNERIKVVLDGWNLYQNRYGGRGCMSASDYDEYSTPSRDTRIQQELQYLKPAAMHYLSSKGKASTSANIRAIYAKYRFEVIPGKKIDLNQLVDAFLTNKALSISEPEHSPEARWGLTPLMVKSQWSCPERASQYYGNERINR